MRADIAAEFGAFKPRAIVLDDHNASRKMTAISLQERGFVVTECETVEQFLESWAPGMVDLIVADWKLSDKEHGDQVLANVRLRDWDVPFVLVSGKLDEHDLRVRVLEVLLGLGGSKFVARGTNGIEKACDGGEELIERRDMTLLRVILALRQGAQEGASIQTSNGAVPVKDQLAQLVAAPSAMHKALAALTDVRSQRILAGGGR